MEWIEYNSNNNRIEKKDEIEWIEWIIWNEIRRIIINNINI